VNIENEMLLLYSFVQCSRLLHLLPKWN